MLSFFVDYSLFGLFIISFLSSTLVPISSEIMVFSALKSELFSPYIIIFVAGIGNTLGSVLNYWMGFFSSKFVEKKLKKALKYQKIIQKHGQYIAFFSWLPFIGDLLVLGMGLFKIKPLPTHLILFFTKTGRYVLLYLLFF